MDSRDLAAEQAMPTPNTAPSVQGMVIADLHIRLQVGIERYGTPLQPHNGRDALRDAYEEALDLACYLRQAIAERDQPKPALPDRAASCSDCGRTGRELTEWWQDGVKLWLGGTCLRRRQAAVGGGAQPLPLGGAR